MNGLVIRNASPSDLGACFEIESRCFAPSEAASRISIEKRIAVFPEGFLVAQANGTVIGMVNSGATHKEDITDEAFKKMIGHDSAGTNMVIFSLAVHPDFQKKGISEKLITHFCHASKIMDKEKILLLCKDYHINYYKKMGFAYGGASLSTHGGYVWHEMVRYLVEK